MKPRSDVGGWLKGEREDQGQGVRGHSCHCYS